MHVEHMIRAIFAAGLAHFVTRSNFPPHPKPVRTKLRVRTVFPLRMFLSDDVSAPPLAYAFLVAEVVVMLF